MDARTHALSPGNQLLKLISRKPGRPTRFENAQRPLLLIYRERCVRMYVISSPLKSLNPSQLFTTTTYFCEFHVLCACTSYACALDTRQRFVIERGKKRRKRKKPKPKPMAHCLGNQYTADATFPPLENEVWFQRMCGEIIGLFIIKQIKNPRLYSVLL